jgi:oligosaccharide amylase
MARAVTIGNGNVLVGIDDRGLVRDFYFPYVGEANHVSGASGNFMHRVGVYVDGQLSWLTDPEWDIKVELVPDSAVGSVVARHARLQVTLRSRDAVHNEQNIFLRHFTVHNDGGHERTIKLFLSQQFRIFESRRGDTAMYDPRVRAIVHYKGEVALLANATVNRKPFSEYNIGLFGIEGKEGTYMDAGDGILSGNPIEHGSVDSVIGLTFTVAAQASQEAYYWIVAAATIPEAHTLDEHVLTEGPERLIASTDAYWRAWLEKEQTDLSLLPAVLQRLYRRSLLIMRAHTDNRGGIIASSDTDMLHHGRDTYSYVWPRDAALIAHAFDITGYGDVARRFYEFCGRCQEPGGYLMHKYRSDGVLGSSWHPWLQHGVPRLPIQEDETASVLFVMWEHYARYHDLEFIESMYNSFIEPAAYFLCEYIEPTTGLPQASYDLWEEKYGISTYTAASVYGGLMAAAKFAALLGKDEDARTYQAIAQRIQSAIGTVLFDAQQGIFVKHVQVTDEGEISYDRTLDASSVLGLIRFRVFDIDDDRVVQALKKTETRLQVHGPSRGVVRYEGDQYYRMRDADTPNPWVITTLWIAQGYIEQATTLAELKRPLEMLEWTESHATFSGVLAEQMHPNTREHLSTAPLVWSHAEFVLTVQAYLQKAATLQAATKTAAA